MFNLATKDNKQYVFSVCVSSLNYPLKNKNVTCYIDVTALSVCTKFYTFSYHMYQFQNNVLYINYVFKLFCKFFYKCTHIENN